MPTMKHGEFDEFGFHFFNAHKKIWGVKLEVAVAMQRRPLPIAVSVVPAGWSDITIARLPGGIFDHMQHGERAVGDPGYQGQPDKIYAPPNKQMRSYVEELDKLELDLQRRVEMANRHLKQFKVLGSVYRKGAVRAYQDLLVLGIAIAKIVVLDMLLNQEHSGSLHTTGPLRISVSSKSRPSPRTILRPQKRIGKLRPVRPVKVVHSRKKRVPSLKRAVTRRIR